jgi:Methyltransferase domain
MTAETTKYDKDVEDSIKFYSNDFLLSIYDINVTYFNNRFAWRCPKERIVEHYLANLSKNHLEVGVASVFYLLRALKNRTVNRLAIMDLNENCLKKSEKKLQSMSPEIYQRNILEPIALPEQTFDSIGLSYVLHVVPGSFEQKGVIFKHLKSLLNEGGTFFGNTLLTEGVNRNYLSRFLMDGANKRGFFHNDKDTLDGLEAALSSVFNKVKIVTVGSAAIFTGSD